MTIIVRITMTAANAESLILHSSELAILNSVVYGEMNTLSNRLYTKQQGIQQAMNKISKRSYNIMQKKWLT